MTIAMSELKKELYFVTENMRIVKENIDYLKDKARKEEEEEEEEEEED